MPRRTTRRSFLLGAGAIVATGVATGVALKSWRRGKPSANDESKTLIAIIDTIVPEDEFAGALDVGVASRMQQTIKIMPPIRKLVERVTPRIKSLALKQHNRPFEQLDQDSREQLIIDVLDNLSQQQLRQDLHRIRNMVLKDYYSTAQGQNSLAYQHPARYRAYGQT